MAALAGLPAAGAALPRVGETVGFPAGRSAIIHDGLRETGDVWVTRAVRL